MFNIFKSKEKRQEDKQINLQKQLEKFIEKNKKYFNSYCVTGKDVIIYKEPEIRDKKISLNYVKVSTPKGYTNIEDIWFLEFKYGDDFMKKHRDNFIRLKDQMEKLGLSITKIEEK